MMVENLEKSMAEDLEKSDLEKNWQDVSFTHDELNHLYNLGVKLRQSGSLKKAKETFASLLMIHPANLIYRKAYAGCLHANGDFAEALTHYQQICWTDVKSHPDCLFYVGVCLYKLDNFVEAQAEFTNFLLQPKINSELKKKALLYLEGIKQKLSS